MRFDKDLWNPTSQEYHGVTVAPQDVLHLTPSARVFIGLWLELLQEDRSPETRSLRSLAIPDQLGELLNSLLLSREDGRPTYRVRSAIGRLCRQALAMRFPFVGDHELRRLCDNAVEWLSLVDEGDQKKRRILEQSVRAKYGYAEAVDVLRALHTRLVAATMGTLAQIRGLPEYKDALVSYVRSKLSDLWISPAQFYSDCSGALCELLALVLDRGNSRESLAELPIRYLRGDNTTQAGKSLPERAVPLFGAFWGSDQIYEVYLPIGDFQLTVHGTIFPPGVSILDTNTWQHTAQGFAGVPGGTALPTTGPAFKVEVDAYLKSGLAQGEDYPRDVFAARDVALRAAQACLDAVFLYREHRIRIDSPCAIIATAPPQPGAGRPPFRTVLHQRHEFRTRTNIRLDFLRPVPASWADALHWYRLGNVVNKDESGIVNLWTSAELLAANCHGTHGTAIDRVRSSVGVVAAVFLFAEQQRYLAVEAARYSQTYGRDAVLNPPAHGAADDALLAWWLDICAANAEAQLCGTIFDMFPLLGVEASAVKQFLGPGVDRRAFYDTHRAAVLDDLCWIYACRNDVVHDGRVTIPGASIARAVASEYVGTALQTTLTMRARGSTSTLEECFALAAEKEITLREHLQNGRLLEAILAAYR
jgi:hypothetical protein